jgi:polysaccharide biosynthesis transport protein
LVDDALVKDRSTLEILWQRRRVVVAAFLVFVVVAGVLSKLLPKVYSATSTMIVVQNENAASFDAVQAAQVTARTFADIVGDPAIASLVAQHLGGGASTASVSSAVTVSPVLETQLLKISAENGSPKKAQELANIYAAVVIQYSQQQLRGSAGASVALATAATRPTSPVRPRPSLYVLIGAILGLFLGIGAAFLLDRLDTRLRSAEAVRARFDEVILARLPRQGRRGASPNAFHEAIGLLRTNLQFASPDRPLEVLAVTSGREGEGKTSCVAELAAAMAEVGSRVLVVDVDFRHPMLRERVMPDRPTPDGPGFADYLRHDAALEEIVHDTGHPGVAYVSTGAVPSNPAAFLESHDLRSALRDLAAHADVVLVDCPPLAAGADASVIAGAVDGVLLLVDLESANERMIRDALRQLSTVRAPTLGFVLNRDRAAELAYDYEYVAQTA